MIRTTTFVAVVLLGFAAAIAQATVIISDDFNAPDNTTLVGRTPDLADVPGGTWASNGYPGFDHHHEIVGNQAVIGVSSAETVAFKSGSYTPAGNYTISADLEINTTTQNSPQSGEALGFWSAPPASSQVIANFSGLVLNSDGGLQLYENGTATGSAIAFGGSFNTSSLYQLSYNINASTGALSNVSLAGSSANYSTFSSSAFTGTAIQDTGFYNSSSTDLKTGFVDNFQINGPTPTPEPASVVLFGLGAVGLFWVARRRNS